MSVLKDFFCKKSGEDLCIINNCGHRGIRDRFALVGFVAVLVNILSFLSCWYSFKMLFDDLWMAIPVSLLFAWMINNIYEVLLTTLSKPVLKVRYQGVIKHLSWTLRLGFIIFFAVFIAKPLEAWIFEPQLSASVESLKAREIAKAGKELEARSAKREKSLAARIHRLEYLKYPEEDILPLRSELEQVRSGNIEALERVSFVVGRADYFIQRIQMLTSDGIYRLSWVFTMLVAAMFLLPIYLKSKINITNPYFKHKQVIYERIVLADYDVFKAVYTDIFHNNYQLDIPVTAIYHDPPFNTERITDKRNFKNQESFFEQFYT
jgi:hypothetical protein